MILVKERHKEVSLKRQKELKGRVRNYSLKTHVQKIFGKPEFMKIKDFPKIQDWETILEKLFKVYQKVIKDSIKVYPEIFANEVTEYFNRVFKILNIKSATPEETFSSIIALQSDLIFLLLGNIGYCQNEKGRSLRGNWDLSFYRQIQIVQTEDQKYNTLKRKIEKSMPRQEIIKLGMEHHEKGIKEKLYYWINNNKMENTSGKEKDEK